MRTLATALTSATLLLAAACGGKSSPPTTTTTTSEAPAVDGAEGTPGTSGYPGIDWGASAADVKAKFKHTAPGTNNLSVIGNHGGKPGITTFEFQDDKLHRISVSYEDDYPSMGACLEVWKAMRAKFDGSLGTSSAENGAAYWDSTTYNITLSCDPGEEERGALNMFYSQPQE